ncbi:energy transducer TonB [Dyella telluris]|uniref:Energy transducer TonB n=1 Tax=Dyella telluris TaxID=2763498 RepID=A0A7G8Q7Q9_9GAMM|nr:energy transducer TonB [Dyella telluris]QNK02817.1 energy transducer TonB [Dyella telluris]
MSSASLAVPRHAHPDSVRIAALSAAIALNLAALAVLMRPMAPALVEQVQRVSAIPISWITPKKEVPPPPIIDLKKPPQPKTPPHTQAVPRPEPVPAPVLTTSDDGTVPAPPATPTLAPPNVDTSAPVEATLAYRATPLKYPPQALHSRLQGQVILKVLVDESGVPQEVTIEQSSGSSLLDRSARDQVLKGWKFEPAMVNGHAVRAWARVPVTFNLNEL